MWEISGSVGGVAEISGLLGCDAVSLSDHIPTPRGIVLPSFSGSLLLDPECECITIVRGVGVWSHSDSASHPRRLEISSNFFTINPSKNLCSEIWILNFSYHLLVFVWRRHATRLFSGTVFAALRITTNLWLQIMEHILRLRTKFSWIN
jgi:hypothetical protein